MHSHKTVHIRARPRQTLLLFSLRVSLIKGAPAEFVDFSIVPDAETTEEQVAEVYDINETLRRKLVAIREDF